MTALPLPNFSPLSPPVPMRGGRAARRRSTRGRTARRHQVRRRQLRRVAEELSLDQQGIRAEWFIRGIEESNCALFHASLYPILPELNDQIQRWLVSTAVDPAIASDHFQIASFALDVIVMAFERRQQWRQEQSVLQWLAGFIPVVCAQVDPS